MNKRRKRDAHAKQDLAATLFAQLFYRQVMEDRRAKLKEKRGRIDDKKKPGVG